jgi:crooked neck
MEEMLGNIAGCRQVFERWMEWEPDEQAWLSYIKMELRYKETDRARSIYEKYILVYNRLSFVVCVIETVCSLTVDSLVMVHPEVKNWVRYASFEERQGFIASARTVYERASDFFGEDHMEENLYVAFAKFEERQKEHERVRAIYKFALDRIPKENAKELFKNYTTHEKKYGDRSGIENVVLSKRKFQYEEEVKANPSNYDAWFDYVRLMESEGQDVDSVREIYERAIANTPPTQEKRLWRRYIYLWIYYAVYEELEAKDMEQTRQVYKALLDILPHRQVSWLN